MKKWVFLLFLLLPLKAQATDHPRLLSTRAGWAAMITSSTVRPWSDIAAGATTFYNSGNGTNWTNPSYYLANLGTGSDEFRQQEQNRFSAGMGVLTLLYVLNTNSGSSITYRNKITALMDVWPNLADDQPLADGYNKAVPLNTAFMSMTLAMDNIHDDLTSVQRSSYHVMMDSYVYQSRQISSSWALNNYGVYLTYEIYRDTSPFQVAADTTCYKVFILGNDTIYPPALCDSRQSYRGLSSEIQGGSQLNVDGVSGSGSSYAWERLGGGSREKMGKWGGVHVLAFTGIDTSYTTSPQMANFYEWLFARHTNPWNAKVVDNDTANNQSIGTDSFMGLSSIYGSNIYLLKNAYFAAGIYSTNAQQYANRSIEVARATATVVYPFEFIDYATVRSSDITSRPVTSTVIRYGGAAFWDEDTSSSALQGVLDNHHITKLDHYHASDWNGLYLAGYGETLLSNPGVGAGTSDGIMGFPWWFHHDDAHAGNVVLFGNRNYAQDLNLPGSYSNSFYNWNPLLTGEPPGVYVGNATGTPLYGGDGIMESVISNKFDYAVGLGTSQYVFRSTTTGAITQNLGQNERNFMFVHADDGANGYWIVVDEARASSMSVNVLWHPYGTSFATTTLNQEYSWPIRDRALVTGTTMTIFLATPPIVITSSHSPFSASPASFVGAYINASYAIDVASMARVATILYPSNPAHTKATFTRLADTGISGASIDSGGGIVDRVFTSSPSVTVSTGGVSYAGRIGFFRKINDAVTQFFVKESRSFTDGATVPYGFTSNGLINIHLNGTTGVISSTGTSVTFYSPGIQGVSIDGVVVSGTDGFNAYTVSVSSGNHDISLSVGDVESSVSSTHWFGDMRISGRAVLR